VFLLRYEDKFLNKITENETAEFGENLGLFIESPPIWYFIIK